MTELKTITFMPNGEIKPDDDSNKTLSTSERLTNYNDNLKQSLQNGIHFTEILNTVITTKDAHVLHDAISELVQYQLNNSYLVFPQQYSLSDFYLIFLNRLLEIHDSYRVDLKFNESKNEFYNEYPVLGSAAYFTFVEDTNRDGGIYYTEQNTNDTLFYLDFKRHLLVFNSEAIRRLLLQTYRDEVSAKAVEEFSRKMLTLGNFIKEDFGFDVDFKLLDPSNYTSYEIMDSQEPSTALDKLFIMSSQAGYMLTSGPYGRADLRLSDNILFTVFPQKSGNWAIHVEDTEDNVSLFDVLNHYDFLRDWYIQNLASVEIKNNPRF